MREVGFEGKQDSPVGGSRRWVKRQKRKWRDSAEKQGSKVDHTIRVVCLAGHSLPIFVLALLSLLVFYATLHWAPGPGRQDILFDDQVPSVTNFLTVDALLARDWDVFRDAVAHLIQPAAVLAYFATRG